MNSALQTKRSTRLTLPTAVLDIDVSADGETVYAACMDGVYRVNVSDQHAQRIAQYDSYVSGVWLVEPERTLVTAGYDGQLQWHDLERRETVRRVQAHRFWSWQSAISPDRRLVASVTGQYLAGGYQYEPAAEQEPSVRIYDARDGQLVREFSHTPPVQSVAFSPDGNHVAAGNLMGLVRLWDVAQGQLVAEWTTPDFTSWGIIKSHCYIGGIFALAFVAGGSELIAAGMGPMRDPMAGNGRQLWQRFAWQENPVRKVDETRRGDSGEGLMETLAVHPDGRHFFMGGRLRGGSWNGAFFDLPEGRRAHDFKSGMRITSSAYQADGQRLFVGGTVGQPSPGDKEPKPFGKVDVYELSGQNR